MTPSDEPSMNKELQQWIKEMKKTLPKQKKKVSSKKPEGLCSICGEHKAQFTCLKCQRFVCPSCYFSIIGICKKCIPKETAEKWEGTQPDWEKILGVKWVD